MKDKYEILKEYFGHTAFREGQEPVVDAILSGRDVLCVMPTGAGKSVCYQVPALAMPGVTLVVSPLISLMKDQVNALTQNGISAAYVNSSLTPAQYEKTLENIKDGAYKLVYVAPERLTSPAFAKVASHICISLIAIDEAHCISKWGQDFRPSYLRIAEFIRSLGYRPTVAAFTATATAAVKADIADSLSLADPFCITTGFDRPNLSFTVIRPKRKMDALLDLLEKRPRESGIVYCITRKLVEEVAERLSREGYAATMYHAGLEDDVRKQNQEDFVYDRKTVMVATNAFGMGIDKSNVSFVIHYNMPMDIESYYQEAGRAGRDGSHADCILLYSSADVQTNQFLIDVSVSNPDLSMEEAELLRESAYARLRKMTFYCTVNTCLRNFILDYFGEKTAQDCGNCSSCLSVLQEVDITVDAQKILSCIKRTGERFGKGMITDILLGARTERLLHLGLDSQTTYGLMRSYKEERVREMIDYLAFKGYLETRGTQYPTLALTARSFPVLFEGERVLMRQAKREAPAPQKSKWERRVAAVDAELYAALKALRRTLADKKGVPAYVIFSDATLADMCKKRPRDAEELLEVSGVGRAKRDLYGESFLKLLRSYATRNADEI